MRSGKLVDKIRSYSVISFLLPLIVLNSCLLIFKIMGDMDLFANYNYNEKKTLYPINEFLLTQKNK